MRLGCTNRKQTIGPHHNCSSADAMQCKQCDYTTQDETYLTLHVMDVHSTNKKFSMPAMYPHYNGRISADGTHQFPICGTSHPHLTDN